MLKRFLITTNQKKQIVNLTNKVSLYLSEQEIPHGVCTIFVMHTTACITVGEMGEGTDEDLLEVAQKFIPSIRFRHAHNPSHAWSHMASSLIGPSLSIPFEDKKLVLGTWQQILLLELDGPRERSVCVSANG